MQLTHQYSSAAASVSGRKNRKIFVSPFAQSTFDAFEPFINIFDPGNSFINPYHTISKEDWEFFRRHKSGETPLFYSDGTKFSPYNHVIRNIYSPEHVQKHFETDVTYYTSGQKGLGLLYLDIDAHHPWQTDQVKAKELLQCLFPFGYFRSSGRGENGYLKIRYSSIEEFNETAAKLQATLSQLFLHFEVLCDVEVKGTITHKGKSGLLAKLPFNTDVWNGEQLELFKSCPVVSIRRVQQIAFQAENLIDDDNVARFTNKKQKIKEWSESRAQIVQHYRGKGFCGTDEEVFAKAKQLRDQALRHRDSNLLLSGETPDMQSPVAIDINEKPKAVINCPEIPVRVSDIQGTCQGDAFARNQKDLAPFVRSFYKKHRTLPELQDALNHLYDNKLFSGNWSDNENGRAKRVSQILASLTESFDPKLLKTGDSKPVELSVEKFRWWVQNHFYKGMTANVVNLQAFDPITLTAPVQRLNVPVEFIETFLSVADFCLNYDPLENKAVPTNRFKKIWKMVKGGASWNQTYYQVVRGRLDRMGVLNIFDRNHDTNKAWRWVAGPNFPAQTRKEHQRKLSERSKGFGLGVSYQEFIANTNIEMNEQVHNTLYQTDAHFLSHQRHGDRKSDIRPPPD